MLFKNPSITYGQTVTFSSYMIEGTLPPIIKVNPTWWEIGEQLVVYAATAA